MSFTLYDYVLSGNCYKVRLFASLLGVSYQTIAVDFHPGKQHRSEAMLKLNPAGTLPVLVTDDQILTETQAMLAWMATKFDDSNTWLPHDDATQLATIMQWLGFSGNLTASVGEARLYSLLYHPIDFDSAMIAAKKNLRRLEAHLTIQNINGEQWIAGSSPTIADIACFPYTALSPDAGLEHDDYPVIRNWLHAVRSLKGFIAMPGIQIVHELRHAAEA
ncbi:MAG: glutathione S-transferase [Gammaproteobacteria bacterium]|jgi:glutathione S-transferase